MANNSNSEKADAAYAQALRRIERCRNYQESDLFLGGLGLTTLPPEIGQLSALTTLHLSDNQLTTLPPEIGQLSALTTLDLNKNQLTTLPPEIGQLNALMTLHLSNNQLTTLPPEIGQLDALMTLHLSNNQLTTLPPEIGRLTQLSRLFLHGNPVLAIPDSVLGSTLNEIYGQKTAARPQDILNFYFTQRQGAVAGTLRGGEGDQGDARGAGRGWQDESAAVLHGRTA